MSLNTQLFVIQPTSFCNLNCGYCYVPDRRDKTHMSEIVLEKAFKCLFADKIEGSIQILYHAGEPMAVGKAFYENALRIINKYKPINVKVTNVIQTNGVLINESWAKFFKQHDFKVGVSIDGPEFLHNHNRKNWSGAGSFNQALRGYKILREYDITTGILSVITLKHLDHANELINFYIENNMIDVGFNIEEIENDNKISSLGDINNIRKDKFLQFMNNVIDIIFKYNGVIRIREISDILYLFLSKKKNPNHQIEPLEGKDLGIITIQKNGDISSYSPEFAGAKSPEYNNFVIGNVLLIDKISDVKNNYYYKKIKNNYEQRRALCKDSCKYFSICGSSFISNSYTESGSLLQTENIGCLLLKQQLTDIILNRLQNLSA